MKHIERANFSDRDRYHYDFTACRRKDGWKQYDTDQDAWYFGVWVHPERRTIITFAEGDESIVTLDTEQEFHDELAQMAEFYGDPPPAFTAIYADGTVEHVYDERPV